jgi:hypothetical protein
MELKTKITAQGRDFCWVLEKNLCSRFAEGLDALRAQDLLDHATLLHHRDLLQVRLERAIGGALRE